MVHNWDARANAILLTEVVKLAKLTAKDRKAIAMLIGGECNAKSVENRVYKLIKDSEIASGVAPSPKKTSGTAESPNGKSLKSAGKPPKCLAGNKRRLSEAKDEEEDESVSSDYPFTPKKIKAENGIAVKHETEFA